MAFPSNQFGMQEPDSEAQILNFVKNDFGVTFPMFSKVEVNGLNTHPVYSYIKNSGPQFAADIEWNFVKFLINREGEVVGRFASPFDRNALEEAIEPLL
mmetsp:Transcript_46897/g.89543  ORF Transcript_46897/g.89543 Transcript_46897/m.89543 type:complete len:99 (+) Transcript_46897:595-891(+)